MLSRLFFAACLVTVPALSQPSQWRAPAGEPPAKPQTPCTALRGLTGYEFSVITATPVAAAAGVPEFCRVMGQVMPEIRFEVSLPAAWNRRLYMFGNGGYAGEDLASQGRVRFRNSALEMGFVVAQHNTGHDAATEPLGSFAVNSQKLLDYAFRSLHVTAETAKKLAAAYYGSGPARSYYQGCSTGGRQGLILAQRFPQDFDGIIAGAPVLDFTGTMLRFTAIARVLAANPIPTSKLKLLADRIYGLCDAKDGLADGLITDPRRCGFEAAQHLPKCDAGDGPDCFTAGQIQALDVIYKDVVSKGKRVVPGWPVGAEIAPQGGRSAWENWILRDGQPSIGVVFAETFFRYLAFPKKDPEYQLSQFDFERDLPRLEWISQVLDSTDPDLSAFRARGGKLLMYFGWADSALNPLMGTEYYESVLRQMGPATGEFFRLYMMPGVFHCAGGVGPSAFDALNPLIDWVEQSKTPESLIASRIEGGKPVRTRPLCPYPLVARYKGSGSIDEAANFACAAPE